MFVLRRWLTRYGLQTGLLALAIGASWFIRQTNGAIVFEVYRAITYPFYAKADTDKVLTNARVLELQAQLAELESQNQQLQSLLNYVEGSKQTGTVAPVIGRSADHWWQQITVSKGTNDGVKVGFVVSGPGGLVGRVVSVTPNTSRVLLVSDPTNQVGVTLSRSRYTGVMRGQSANKAVLDFFDKAPNVRRGDVVTTSFFSQLYPAGIPVGRIESVDLTRSPSPQAIVELSAPIGNLEWVVLLPHTLQANPSNPK